MKKEQYEAPLMEIVEFEAEDILTESKDFDSGDFELNILDLTSF